MPEEEPQKPKGAKLSIYIYFFLISLVVLYIIFIMFKKTYYIKITGFIKTDKAILQSDNMGIVNNVYIKEGKIVKKGQPIASITYYIKGITPLTLPLTLTEKLYYAKAEFQNIEQQLKNPNTPQILQLINKIQNLKVLIQSKKLEYNLLNKQINNNRKNIQISRLLELSTIDPSTIEKNKLNIESLQMQISQLSKNLKLLKKEKEIYVNNHIKNLESKKIQLKKEITFLENMLNSSKDSEIQTKVESIIRSPIKGKVLKVFVKNDIAVDRNTAIAVIAPIAKTTYFYLYSNAKSINYFKKGKKITILLPDREIINGTISSVYSAAIKYPTELSKNYWPIPSPIVIQVKINKIPERWVNLDGVKVKAILKRF
jgi:biotin carboxyl carrier protein